MGSFTAKTTIGAGSERITASASGNYDEIFRATLTAPFGTATTGTLQEAIQTHTVTSAGYARNLKYLLIKNIGQSAIELSFTIETWTDSAPDAHTADSERFLRFLIPVGDYMLLPNIRLVDWGAEATGASAGVTTATGITPDANLYEALDTIATGDAQLLAAEVANSTVETFTIDDASFLYPSDLIQLETEICEVVEIQNTGSIEVRRGAYGSTADAHADDTPIRLPFFNAYHQYGDTSKNGGGNGSAALCKTDVNGNYRCFNHFGVGRDASYEADGLTPGSFSLLFRTDGGYQELGMSGITSSTNSGLAASTIYGFDLTVDGSGLLTSNDMRFTTDANTLTFGGTSGIISKIQAVLDEQYYTTSSPIFEERVTISIVGGDIRFSSSSNLSTSAILLATGSVGMDTATTPFGVGRFPAIGSINTAVPKTFPRRYLNKDEIVPIVGAQSSAKSAVKDISSICYDDGKGKILGAATGTISYSSGALDIRNGPPNAEFLVFRSYGSALSGGIKTSTANCNAIKEFRFRGTNWNLDATIEFIGMN